MRIKSVRRGVDEEWVGVKSHPEGIREIRAVSAKIEITISVVERKVMIHDDSAAMGLKGAEPIVAIAKKDVVFDIDPTQVLPEDDAIGAVEGHDIVVNFEITDSGVPCDLQPGGSIGQDYIIDDGFVLTAEIKAVIEIAAGSAIVMDVVGGINVAAGRLTGVDAVLTLVTRVGWVAVVVNVAIEDLVVITPNVDPASRPIPDLKTAYDVVAAINIYCSVAIRQVLAIDDSGPGQ